MRELFARFSLSRSSVRLAALVGVCGLCLSAPATASANEAPEIVVFGAYEGSHGLWYFEGTVVDENPSGMVVNFGGLLAGESTVVDSSGEFTYVIYLAPGEGGTVSAQTEDFFGVPSNQVFEFVAN